MLNAGERLRIDVVDVPGAEGRLGLCACPGGRRVRVADEDPRAGLARDLEAVLAFGAAGVVTLVAERELVMLGVDTLPLEVGRAGLWWTHLPIADMGIPDRAFEARWEHEGPRIRAALASGENVLVHCWAGLGRTGTVAARLLVESGMEPAAAILRVRDARPGAIQTRRQEKYVLKLRPGR